MTGDRRTSARAVEFGFGQLVRRGLRGVWLRGELPAGPFVWAANHHSWWDGFVASAVLRRQDRPAALLMDNDNLGEFGFLASIGVISTGRPRQALAALGAGSVLVVYPEAELLPPGPVGGLAPGAGWLARQAGVPLVPVAVRTLLRGHQHAEAFVDVGVPVADAELPAALSSLLSGLDELLRRADPRQAVPGFDRVTAGRSSWDELITRWSTRLRR